jgi:uncharacterized YigZ family protein
MTQARYPIPAEVCRCETEVQRSVFITTIRQASSLEGAAAFVTQIKTEFPDANHNCWAYLVGPPGSSDRIGLSDDGEPHGAAGKPLLTCLQYSCIGDIAIVVSRYFGGIKLGKGGMVKAYTLAAQNGLKDLVVAEKIDWRHLAFSCDYGLLQQIELLLPRFEGEIRERKFAEAVAFQIRCPTEQTEALSAALIDLSQGRIHISCDQ